VKENELANGTEVMCALCCENWKEVTLIVVVKICSLRMYTEANLFFFLIETVIVLPKIWKTGYTM
jgi:hypothetical protein